MTQTRRYFISREGEEPRVFEVTAGEAGVLRIIDGGGNVVEVDAFSPGPGQLHLLIDGRSRDVDVLQTGAGLVVQVEDRSFSVDVVNERERRMRAATGRQGAMASPELTSPMAGKVVKILARPGQVVEEGQPLVVVEAMKMENDLKAHRPGVIGDVGVTTGQAVEIGDVLLRIEEALVESAG
jgi:biotin carboxyl carrier protein